MKLITETETDQVLYRLNEVISLRLLSAVIPEQFTSFRVANGRAFCQVKGEFEVPTPQSIHFIYYNII